ASDGAACGFRDPADRRSRLSRRAVAPALERRGGHAAGQDRAPEGRGGARRLSCRPPCRRGDLAAGRAGHLSHHAQQHQRAARGRRRAARRRDQARPREGLGAAAGDRDQRQPQCPGILSAPRLPHRGGLSGRHRHHKGAQALDPVPRPEPDPDARRDRAGDRSVSTSPRRLVGSERRDEDVAEASLRPQLLSEFVGQAQACSNLGVFIAAARARKEALDHVLFVGPPGLGKTTLAQIVARELGVNFRATSGPVIAKAGDLAALLTNLEDRDVPFLDAIHRLNPAVEEILYPAMEDFQLDLIIGEGPAARSVKIDLARFTLIGATTRAGLLTNPLRDRFGIPMRLNFYTEAELEEIVNRGARVLGVAITPDGANEIARRARGTPRIAGRLLRRIRDFAHVRRAERIDRAVADQALRELEVDGAGLDAMDRRYLNTIAVSYGGG